ncbi:MAG: TetR/AcrR family transcriptional regulator [Pseudomonadota bacterium]
MSDNPDIPADEAGPKRRTGGRSALVLQAVARAVMDELAECGIENFSVPKVAGRAGVSSSSIYRRWPTKADLIVFAGAHHSETQLPMPNLGTLRADLLRLVEDVARYVLEPKGQGLIAMAFGRETAGRSEVQDAFWRLRTAQHQPMFARALARGELPPGADTGEIMERAIGPIYIRAFMTRQPMTAGFLARVVDSALVGFSPAAAPAKRSARTGG